MPTSQKELNWISKNLIEVLPAAVYVCNLEGVVVAFNRCATELWGRTPRPGDTDEKFCGSHRLYHPDGTHMPHAETPMEAVLRAGDAAVDLEAIVEQPNGVRLVVLVNIAPLFNESGKQIGAVNCFQDLSVQKAVRERSSFVARRVTTVAEIGGRDRGNRPLCWSLLGESAACTGHEYNGCRYQ